VTVDSKQMWIEQTFTMVITLFNGIFERSGWRSKVSVNITLALLQTWDVLVSNIGQFVSYFELSIASVHLN